MKGGSERRVGREAGKKGKGTQGQKNAWKNHPSPHDLPLFCESLLRAGMIGELGENRLHQSSGHDIFPP